MLRMDDKLTLLKFGEIDRGSGGPLLLPAKVKPSESLAGRSPKELGIGKHRQLTRRKTETAGDCPNPHFREILSRGEIG